MGQYYLIVNVTKKQIIRPNKFGDGLKLMEFGISGFGAMYALAALLASGNNRGGGDIPSDHPIIGSWAGDSIVITGDYGDNGLFGASPDQNLYSFASSTFKDISQELREVLIACDSYHNLAKEWAY